MTDSLRGLAFALISFSAYATHDAVIKLLGAGYSPLQILFFSVLLAFPLVSLTLITDREAGSLVPRNPKLVAFRSAAMILGGVCGFTAFTLLPLAQAYAIFFCVPLLVTIIAVPVLGERIGWHRGGAIIAGLIGVVIALDPRSTPLNIGHLAAGAAAICVSIVSILSRILGNSERHIVLMLYPMIGNLVVIGAALPFVYQPMPLADFGLMVVVAGLSFIGARFTIMAFAAGEASLVAPMQYAQIIWAVFYGYLFFNEGLTRSLVLGLALVILSGIYILFREMRAGSKTKPALKARGFNTMDVEKPKEE